MVCAQSVTATMSTLSSSNVVADSPNLPTIKGIMEVRAFVTGLKSCTLKPRAQHPS